MITADRLIECGLDEADAAPVAQAASAILSQKKWEDAWTEFRHAILQPEHPMAVHRLLFDAAYAGWDVATQGPAPVWRADYAQMDASNMAALMRDLKFSSYDELYHWSIEHGRQFWARMVSELGLHFKNDYVPTPDTIVDLDDTEEPRWLPGAELNVVEACFTAAPDETAILYQREGEEKIHRISYAELDARSNRVANALLRAGCQPGDKFAIDMPMHVDAVVIYLGLLKSGCAVVSLADSFKAPDVEVRLEAAAPVKGIFVQETTGGARRFALYEEVLKAKNLPPAVVLGDAGVMPSIKRGGDISWQDFLTGTEENFTPVPLEMEHDLVIIFSSSTSSPKEQAGDKPKPPKAIPWRANTAIKSVVDAKMHHDMQPGKVLCWPTNLGWMMGSFAIFGALGNKGTLALFEGNVVSAEFCQFVERARINVLGLVPTIAEGWEQKNLTKGCDWSAIEVFSSTGSPSNPNNYFYLMARAPGYRPVLEYMGGTEIGGGYLQGSVLHPAAPSCFTTPCLGTDIFTPEEDSDDWRKGEVFIVMRDGDDECPPMGLSTQLLNFDHHDKYFGRGLTSPEGYLLREHGDVIMRYPGGFIASGGRSDDGINLNGIKTSSLDIENYIKDARIEGLIDLAAIGVRPPEGGEDWLVIYAVTNTPELNEETLKKQCREAIKARNPQLARIQDVVLIEKLPLTASGKLRRRYLQDSYLEQWLKKSA